MGSAGDCPRFRIIPVESGSRAETNVRRAEQEERRGWPNEERKLP